MSVLIKGMDMPETCEECSFHCYHSDGKYVCVATPLFYPMNFANSKGIRKDFCPLVEISEPHGRLIDASNKVDMPFYDDEYEEHSMRTVTVEELLMAADNEVPTVIEAEGSEDHDD